MTAARLAVLEVISGAPHTTAEEIHRRAQERAGTLSRQAVYDTLATLSELGVLRRIQPSHSPARYETRTGDNHHHLVCRTCGRVVDVDCAVGYRPCLEASQDHGYLIDEAEVIYWGTCPDCLDHTASPSTRPVTRSTPSQDVGPTPTS